MFPFLPCKILTSRKLLALGFEEAEKLFSACLNVFNNWDDEYNKLLVFLKELFKKSLRKDDPLKSFLIMNPAHKKLQVRIEDVKK